MENLDTKELKDTLLKNDSETYRTQFYEKYILNNDNISSDTKISWPSLFSKNYALMDLTREDIDEIMKMYNVLEQSVLCKLDNNDPDVILNLQLIRISFMISLNRAQIPTYIYKDHPKQTSILDKIKGYVCK